MSDATKTSFETRDKEMRRRAFEYMAEEFIERYAPDDPREAARFSAELFSILRTLCMEISEPWVKQVTDVLASYPIRPFVKP